MAAVIPEAAGAVESGTAAVEGASARHARSTRLPAARERDIAAAQQAREQKRAGRANRAQAPAAPRQARAGTPPRGGSQRERQFKKSAKKAGRGALKARLPGAHSYQPVILAEFLVAVVVVAVSPVAKGGSKASQAKGSPSPYDTNTLKQLIAIGGVYFVLALLGASRRAGRYAAWFGGLVLLGLGLAELATGDLQALFGIFGPGKTPSQIMGQGVVSPGTAQQIQNAAQNALNPNPTAIFPTIEPGGQVVPATQQTITFSGPGVATTTETSPGVTVT